MTKTLKLYLVLVVFILCGIYTAQGQNVLVNTLPAWNEVQVGAEGLIQIQFLNTDDTRSVPAGSVRVSFSLNPNQEVIPNDDPRDGFYTGPQPEGWVDLPVSMGGYPFVETSAHWDVALNDGQTFAVVNNQALPPLAEEYYYVRYKGLAPGTQIYIVNILFIQPLPGNINDDDMSQSQITIVDKPLPINLLSFDAVKNGDQVDVSWSTTSEQNNAGFDIERSANGQNWQNIGHVASKGINGNSHNVLDYQFKDETPLKGINYYRLRQTDLDGHSLLSDVRTVQIDRAGTIQIYPNPVRSSATVRGLSGGETLKVYDARGKIVSSVKSGSEQASLNFSNLAQGIYRVVVTGADGQLKQTLSVTKAK